MCLIKRRKANLLIIFPFCFISIFKFATNITSFYEKQNFKINILKKNISFQFLG